MTIFLEHLTQLCALGVTMVLVGGRKKNEIASKMILSTWGKKRGGIQSQILICKKNFWKISKSADGRGGGVRCHSTPCEIAGFSHGFRLFSIVSPYEYLCHSLKWKRTSVRSFCDMIRNCTLRTKISVTLRIFVRNAEKNAQCHFSRAGSTGTD